MALWHVVNEKFDSCHDVLYPYVLVYGPVVDTDVFGVEVTEESGQGLSKEAGVAPQDGVSPDSQLQRILPQVDATLELKRVGIRRASVNQAPDHVLVGRAQDPLTNEEALDTKPVPVQAHRLQFLSVTELNFAPETIVANDGARLTTFSTPIDFYSR